ncbi:IS200/IS605 family transposase [Fulvivirga lutea]|uniref:IS200/IS605 family transposase n=1 Tax=Fulvivirga lutea TaxID=2810512 RepID=A0A974WMZ9_9BACT|nr:IS200/IS605 family transposase [Fulvivirga lutea]QSE99275.1 IS200/IS605 family transposase [Fulvivirga lutea]
MSTYTQILYQIVFSTKGREKSLSKLNREKLFKYISRLLENKKCHLYRINGIKDHIHILTHLHPTVSLSSLVKDIKLASTAFIKEEKLFPNFKGWQEGYGAFTYSIKAKERLINYVMNQEKHHSESSFLEEYKNMLISHEVEFDEKYLL